jgi:hypothetical protein
MRILRKRRECYESGHIVRWGRYQIKTVYV